MSEAKSTSPLESIEEFFLYELPEVRGTWHALCNALARLLKRLNPTERSHGGTLHLSRVMQWMVGPSASVQDRSICPSSINEHSQRRAGENRQKFVRVDTLSLDSSAGVDFGGRLGVICLAFGLQSLIFLILFRLSVFL